ncbi:hypothetical protein B0H17DRAFT_947184, partial [Mycena rosella]
TLTAEAVAEHLKRPLYIVGASELSTNPSALEDVLKSIFSLAMALWFLHGDVFLEQRSLHEVSRALPWYTLRVLEYHRGVLLLTTNHIKNFDIAFLSRFSIGELMVCTHLTLYTTILQPSNTPSTISNPVG